MIGKLTKDCIINGVLKKKGTVLTLTKEKYRELDEQNYFKTTIKAKNYGNSRRYKRN